MLIIIYIFLQIKSSNHIRIQHPTGRSVTRSEYAKSMTIESLRPYFYFPINIAAKEIGTCATALKKICRKNNVLKWPYRILRSLMKSIQSLEMATLNEAISDSLKLNYIEQIKILRDAVEKIIEDPNADVVLDTMGLQESVCKEFNDDLNASSSEFTEVVKQSKRKANNEKDKKDIKNDNNYYNYNNNSTGSSYDNKNKVKTKKMKKSNDNIDQRPLNTVNPRFRAVMFDNTIASIDTNPENCKYLFSGPIQLALLQRTKTDLDFGRKLIPLVEPDISNNYQTEFVPQFMSKIDILNEI